MYVTANFWPTVSATAGLLVNFGHTLSVGLLVRPWPYRPYWRRRPCLIKIAAEFMSLDWTNALLPTTNYPPLYKES